jgi:TerC family integral membrane protein
MIFLATILSSKIVLWIGFNILILILLAIDLGIFHRKDHVITVREGLIWSGIWIVAALAFNLVVYLWKGHDAGLQFLTGYLIERALSIDNIFVFLLVFTYFQVPGRYQYRVLFWGILGALILRGLFIALGTILIAKFHWILYVFGAFLIITAIKLSIGKEKEIKPEKNPLLRVVRRFLPITENYEKGHFLVRRKRRIYGTPLLIVLLVVESTDLVFALDSIPAIFAITLDPFIVYTSNVFAILGLRALYFAIAGLMQLFYYLKYALSAILAFVGFKMLFANVINISSALALIIIATIFMLAIVLSLIFRRGEPSNSTLDRPAASIDKANKKD